MAPQVFLGRAKGTHERGVLVVLVRRRSPLALTLIAGVDRPRLLLPYVANICFRCFSRFKGILQLFLLDVANVDQRMLYILQVFQKHVANVYSKC
jgi:hypothetical protein